VRGNNSRGFTLEKKIILDTSDDAAIKPKRYVRDLAAFIPLHHAWLDKFGACEMRPEDWFIEGDKLILDLAREK
jgi:hypothetical protein